MSEKDKPTEAEEIFSEFQEKKKEKEKLSQVEPEPLEKPESVQPEPEPHKEPEAFKEPEPEPQKPENEESTEEPEETKPAENPPSEPEEKTDSESKGRNVIFVGTKPLMTYVTATLTQLSSEPTVTIKARGRRITQAVDVSQMIVKRMVSVGYQVSDVRISSDSLTSQDGRLRNVSTIEVDVTKTTST